MKITLHHFAYNITPGSLELVLEMFEKFNCKMSYRRGNERWCLIEQKEIPVEIQIIETEDSPVATKTKINTHIAFLSDKPEKVILEIGDWAKEKGLKFKKGAWSDNELWFDLSDIFVNFAIEIMRG